MGYGIGSATVLNLGSSGTFTLESRSMLVSSVNGPSGMPGYDGVTIIADTIQMDGNDTGLQFAVGINEAILTLNANHFTGTKIGGNAAVFVDWWGGGGTPNKTLVNGETWILVDTGTSGTTANFALFFFAYDIYWDIMQQHPFTNYVPWRGSTGGYSGITLGLATNADQSQLLLKAVDSSAYSDALYWTGKNCFSGDNSVWSVDNTWNPLFPTEYFYRNFSDDNSNWYGEVGQGATSSGIIVLWFLNGTGTNGDHVIFADTISGGEIVATIENKEVIVSHSILGAGPIVRSMAVTGTGYEFDLTAGGNILTAIGNNGIGGDLDFGTATLMTAYHAGGTTIQAAGTITLDTGSKLEYDLSTVSSGSTMLTLTGTSETVHSDIYVTSLPTLVNGQSIILVQTGTNGAVASVGELYVDGSLYTPQRSTTAGAMMYGLATDTDNTQLSLKAVSATGNSTDLIWTGTQTGRIWDINTNANWNGTVNDIHITTFLNGDTVSFTNSALATNRTVTVANSGVSVGSMSVTGTGYTFNLTVGTSPAITSTGTINLGDATLNITGYTPGNPNPYTTSVSPQTVISAGGTLSGFNPAVTVLNQANTDFLTASAFQEGNEVKVETRLSWDSTDPNRKAHGNFTIDSGEFTLGATLADNSASTNRNGWDGNSLHKMGAGMLVMNAVNTYTGLSTVDEGTLLVGNSNTPGARIAGAVDVESGATLGGYGTIAGLITVKSGATLSPGSSIGTLNAENGIIFESGSTYLYEIDPDNSDKLVVSNGNVEIQAGARLNVALLGGASPSDGATFWVIEAADTQFVNEVGGEKVLFTPFGTWAGQFDQAIESDGYWITWKARIPGFADALRGLGTPNAINAAAGMDEIVERGETAQIDNLYNALAGMDASKPEELADAFAQLHGEVFASNKEAAAQRQRRFLLQLPSTQVRLACGEACLGEWNRWATLTGDLQGRRNLGRYSGYDLRTAGIAVGIDRHITRNSMFGMAVGYDNSFQDFRTIRSQNQMDTFRSVFYGGWWKGDVYVDGYAGYTKDWYKTRRDMNIGAFHETARSQYNDDMFSTGFEIGRALFFGKGWLTPGFGLHYIHLSAPGITETGGGDANLYVHGGRYHSLRMPVGAKWSRDYMGGGIVWSPEVRAFYVRETADDSVKARISFAGVREVSFESGSGQWGRNSARLGIGLGAMVSSRLNARLDYDVEVYNHTTADTFSATLGVMW